MSSLWRWLLGINGSPGDGAAVGQSRLELTALPDGGLTLILVLAAPEIDRDTGLDF